MQKYNGPPNPIIAKISIKIKEGATNGLHTLSFSGVSAVLDGGVNIPLGEHISGSITVTI